MVRVGAFTLLASSIAVAIGAAMPADPLPLLSYVRVGGTRVAFESDTFSTPSHREATVQSTVQQVERALGRTVARDTGDAAGHSRLLCYRLGGRSSDALVFESSEMGGGTRITGFNVVPAGTRPDLEQSCRSIPVGVQSVVTDRGIRIGLTRKEVDALLGRPGRDSAGVVLYEKDVDSVWTDHGKRVPYNQSSGFNLIFTDGRLAAIYGWRVDAS